MKVAIGIPTFNQDKYIREAIESCLRQDYTQLSLLVSDDQSSDKTELICKSLNQSNLRYFKNSERLGRLGNYRKLLNDYADGSDWYLNLDGDDYLTDNKFIGQALQLIENHNPAEIVFFQANQDLSRLKKIFNNFEEISDQEILVDGKDYFRLFYKIRKFSHAATLYNRKKAMALNFYSSNSLSSDFHSVIRLALTGKVILSGKNVAYWRLHDNNDSQALNEKIFQNELNSLEEIAMFSKDYLSEKESREWLKGIRRYYKESFIYLQSTAHPGAKTILYLFKNWRFDVFYVKWLLKNIFTLRNSNKRPAGK